MEGGTPRAKAKLRKSYSKHTIQSLHPHPYLPASPVEIQLMRVTFTCSHDKENPSDSKVFSSPKDRFQKPRQAQIGQKLRSSQVYQEQAARSQPGGGDQLPSILFNPRVDDADKGWFKHWAPHFKKH